jgi:hypothetical protein
MVNKRLGTLFLLTVVVGLFANTNPTPSSHTSSPRPQSPSKVAPHFQNGSVSDVICDKEGDPWCTHCAGICPASELVETIESFYDLSSSNGAGTCSKQSALHATQQMDDLRTHWGVPECARKALQFVVALIPDPTHTHLSMFFDRQIDAIEEAVQEEGFLFDRAWLPWDARSPRESTDIKNQLLQQKYAKARERFPGLMIFRKAAPVDDEDFHNSLFVFVVGETPTGGINKTQFDNALSAILAIRQRRNSAPELEELRVLGPTFSGSLYSLMAELKKNSTRFLKIVVHSGTTSSWETIAWFQNYCCRPLNLEFMTFHESDCYILTRFLQFVRSEQYSSQRVAVLSEDETAYGNQLESTDAQSVRAGRCTSQTLSNSPPSSSVASPCDGSGDVLHLYFPREISQLRSAYQRDLKENTTPDSVGTRPPRSTLRSNLDDSGSDDDSVPTYSALQTPLSQESVLMGIVSHLRKNHIQFIVIQATNPLDTLFLSRYLRIAFPDARIVTVGADLLFQREVDDTRFQGILAVDSYSLIPGLVDESSATLSPSRLRRERVFPFSYSVGTYNSMLSLLSKTLDRTQSGAGTDGNGKCERGRPRHADVNYPPDLPEAPFAQYAWPRLAGKPLGQNPHSPPLWLTVIGRDGYWPVAILDSQPFLYEKPNLASNIHATKSTAQNSNIPSLHHLPFPWKILCSITIAIIVAYLTLILSGNIASPSETIACFANVKGPARNYILFVVDVILLILLLLLLWPAVRQTESGGDAYWNWLLGVTLLSLIVMGRGDLKRRGADRKARAFVITSIILIGIGLLLFAERDEPYLNLLVYRYIHITSGVSPLVPLFLLTCSVLWWAWYSLNGLGLLDQRRPRLPKRSHLGLTREDIVGVTISKMRLGGVSREANANLTTIMQPANSDLRIILPPMIVAIFCWLLFANSHPVQSLEGKWFDVAYSLMLLAVVFVLLCTVGRLLVTWMEFHLLLLALDRLPLRRGFKRLKGFAWKPIWRLGGMGMWDFFRLISRELETLNRFHNIGLDDRNLELAFEKLMQARKEMKDQYVADLNQRRTPVSWTQATRLRIQRYFALVIGKRISGIPRHVRLFFKLQKEFAATCGAALNYLSLKWDSEKTVAPSEPLHPSRERQINVGPQESPQIQLAEQFVCLAYLTFILSVLLRIRTLVMTVAGMYVFILLSFGSYPFEPKATFHVLMVLLLISSASIVGFVFAQMHQDATLSRITDTTPGELGIDFWIRLASFLAVPLLSLLSVQFPAITNFLFSWMQPALQAFR